MKNKFRRQSITWLLTGLLVWAGSAAFVARAQNTFTALTQILTQDSAWRQTITANAGFQTIYALKAQTQPGDILRIRGQVEMTNDTPPYPGGSTETVRGEIRLCVNGTPVGLSAAQHNVSFPQDPNAHHMHHMPLWADAVYTATKPGESLIEVQYAVSKQGSNPTVKIEPYKPSTPYGQLVAEQYHTFPNRQAAEQAHAWGLSSLLSDRTKHADTFLFPTTLYSLPCAVDSGDLIRLFGQATSLYRDLRAFQAQRIDRNGERISPYATENNTYRMPELPLWTDAVDHPLKDTTLEYSLRVHSLIDQSFGSAGVADLGHLHCLQYKNLSRDADAKQLTEAKMITRPQDNLLIHANTGWQKVFTYRCTAQEGDILKITGLTSLALPATFPYGVLCQLRIKVQNQSAESMKYVTEWSEELPLRTELLTRVEANGTYSIDMEIACVRTNGNPHVVWLADRSGLLVERFSHEPAGNEPKVDLDHIIQLFPNPASESFTIKQIPEHANVQVVATNGKTMFTSLNYTGSKEIPTAHFAKGIYYVYIRTEKGILKKKLIIQ